MSNQPSIVVIGAGISGLAAALRIQRAGAQVTVLESQGETGGRIRTERVGDYLVDSGPDAATDSYEQWLDLVDELGLTDRVAPTSAVIGTVRHGRVIDIDPGRPIRAALTPALSLGGKLRMARGLVRLRKQIAAVDSFALNRSAERDDPERSGHEFSCEHFGTEATEYVIDGAVRLATGSGSRESSALAVLGVLGAWSGAAINIRGGLQSVTDAAAERLADLRLGATVTGVAEKGDRVTVEFRDAGGDEATIEADGCVIATMYDAARELWPALDGLAPGFAEALRPVQLVSVSLGYVRKPDTDAYIVSVPTADHPDLLLVFMQHNKAPDRAPGGHGLVTLYTDTLATPRFLDRSDEEIVEWGAETIERICPELAGRRDMGHVRRWPNAGYLADPGFWLRSRELLDAIPADGRIRLAGDLFGAGSMESSVRWGRRAADSLLALQSNVRGSRSPVEQKG